MLNRPMTSALYDPYELYPTFTTTVTGFVGTMDRAVTQVRERLHDWYTTHFGYAVGGVSEELREFVEAIKRHQACRDSFHESLPTFRQICGWAAERFRDDGSSWGMISAAPRRSFLSGRKCDHRRVWKKTGLKKR